MRKRPSKRYVFQLDGNFTGKYNERDDMLTNVICSRELDNLRSLGFCIPHK